MVQFRGEADVETLQQECSRLKNAIHHLERSIAELQEARQQDSDPQLLEAIQVCLQLG